MSSLVDDHTRLAHSEILPDKTGKSRAAFLERTATYFAAKGVGRIERVMTDNAFAYLYSAEVKKVCADLCATQKLT